MNANMRPSGESAGATAESAKLVSWTYSLVAGPGDFLARKRISAAPASNATTMIPTTAATSFDRLPRSGEPRGAAVTEPESDSASSANARSEADWKRCSGFFSRQRWTTLCSPGGASGTSCETPGGSSFRMAVIVSAEVGF